MELTENLNLENNNNSFFESTFGRIINNSIDTGLKVILPDFLENDVIDVKNTLVEEGFSEAIKSVIDKAVNAGKTALGIVTGNFEDVSQAKMAVEKGGLIDGVSDTIDFVLDKVKDSGLLSKDIVKSIKKGKDLLLNNVSSDIKQEFEIQSNKMEKLDKYNEKWRQAYENQDFKTMEKNIKKIDEILKDIMPVENIIKDSRIIENLHTLIKNNGQNFELTDEEQQLAELLS